MARYSIGDGEWCKVEIMGHVEHIGRVSEFATLNGKLLRVCDETESEPVFYGLGAIFSLRWMSEEEGSKLSTRRAAEWEEQGRRHARGLIVGTIQQSIREALADGKKMPRVDILAAIVAQAPDVDIADFDEAFRDMSLDVIPTEEQGGTVLYWIDPDGSPW